MAFVKKYIVKTHSGSTYFLEEHYAVLGGDKWFISEKENGPKHEVINFAKARDYMSKVNRRYFLPGMVINYEFGESKVKTTAPIIEIWQRIH